MSLRVSWYYDSAAEGLVWSTGARPMRDRRVARYVPRMTKPPCLPAAALHRRERPLLRPPTPLLEGPLVRSRASPSAVLFLAALFGLFTNASLVQAQAAGGGASTQTQVAPRPIVTLPEAVGFGVVLASAFLADEALRGEFGDPSYRPLFYQAADGLGNGAIVLPILGGGFLLSRYAGNAGASRAFTNAIISGLAAGAAAQVLKLVVGRVRPNETEDSGVYNPFEGHAAFPSGHATFASAVLTSLVMDSSSRGLRYAAYGGVAAAALARLHYNRHWTSDVVAGAALGVVTTRLVARFRDGNARVEAGPAGIVVRVLF